MTCPFSNNNNIVVLVVVIAMADDHNMDRLYNLLSEPLVHARNMAAIACNSKNDLLTNWSCHYALTIPASSCALYIHSVVGTDIRSLETHGKPCSTRRIGSLEYLAT